jgi:hypothetical protein
MSSKEPARLRRGKAFHKKIQKEWIETAQGKVWPEKTTERLTKRRGRIDILVDGYSDDKEVAVVEIKASDWDRMKPKAVRRNALRQVRQIWSYIDAQLDLEGNQVSPGIIFPKRPKDSERLKEIEEIFNEWGIQVVWHDETTEELKELLGAK